MEHARSDQGSWLGIDLGTQSVRVLVVSGAGEVLARSAVALTSSREGERHEQDPEDWWSAVVRAAQVATREVDAGEIRGVSACGTSGTVLFVDEVTGDPACPSTPALMYDDGRAAAQAERAGVPRSWGLAKAHWLLEHHDLPHTARLAHQVDLVLARLAGRPVATDWSNALKSGVDPSSGTWPAGPDGLDALGLDALGLGAQRLPEVVAPGTPVGAVSEDAAALTGIPAGTPLVAGLTDGCAAQVAAGALEIGAVNLVIGTTLVLKACAAEPVLDPAAGVYSHRSPDGDWWPGGASNAGAGALQAASAELDAQASEREPASALAYPLVGQGERFPFVRPDAEAFVVGDAVDTVDTVDTVDIDDTDRYAAILQGVAFCARLCLEQMAALGAPVRGPVSLTGGGARSAYWCQLIADVLDREVLRPEVTDGALGMAVVAASTAHGSLREAAAAMVRTGEPVRPRPGARERWERPYARWRAELEERGWLGAA